MVAVPAYATPTQLNTRLGRTVAADRATDLLDEASALVDDYLGYPLTEVAGYVRTFTAGGPVLYLPRRFRAVTAVDLNGTTLLAEAWAFDVEAHTLSLTADTFRRGDVVKVTGTSGYAAAAIPKVVRSVVLSAAGRAVDNPAGGLRADSLSDHAVTFSSPDPKGQGATTGGVYLISTETEALDNAGLRDWAFG